jgi:hypothetical protein
MKKENRKRLKCALDNAAEMIRGHSEVGLSPEDVSEVDEAGLREYVKATQRAFKMITTLANKYK